MSVEINAVSSLDPAGGKRASMVFSTDGFSTAVRLLIFS